MKSAFAGIVYLVLGLLAGSLTGPTGAADATLPVVADTWLNGNNPDANLGRKDNVSINYSAPKIGLARFDIAPQGGADVHSATLRFFVNSVTRSGDVKLHMIRQPWDENSVTLNTAPHYDLAPISTLSVNISDQGALVSADVTSAVQQWVADPASNYGIALTSDNAVINIDSRDMTGGTPMTIDASDQLQVRTQFNALVLNYNPRIVDSDGTTKTVTEALGMREIEPLMADYIDALKRASGGQVNWHVAETFELDEFPPENDPDVTYTPDNYLSYLNSGYDMFGDVDYVSIANDPRFGIVDKVELGTIDAIWVFSFPSAGFWETAMAGEGAYYVNGGPIYGVDSSRKFVFYGFGRGAHQHYGFMLENTGHMVENILFRRGYNWPDNWTIPVWYSFDLNSPERRLVNMSLTDWQLFHLTDALNYDAPDQPYGTEHLSSPGNSHVGTVHYPPNGIFNYGWPPLNEDFNNASRWIPFGGAWRIENGQYVVDAGNGVKSLLHDGGPERPVSMSEFIAEGDVSLSNDTSGASAGFLFRMQKFSTGPNQGQGYYAAIDAYNDRVVLYRMDYGLTELGYASLDVDAGAVYRIKISSRDDRIRVYVGNPSVPIIDVMDSSFPTGGFGVSADQTAAAFDNIDANVMVSNYADRWHDYPDLSGAPRPVNSLDWDGAHEEYLSWWFEHIPKNPGTHDNGILNTWWPYIFDLNQFDPGDRYTHVMFADADTSSPEAPTGLGVVELNAFSVRMAWSEPDDNVGVTRYDIYRNDDWVQQVPGTVFTDEGLLPDTSYTYEIVARDGSANLSSPSAALTVTTLLSDPEGLQNGDFEQGGGDIIAYWSADPWRPGDAIMSWDPVGEGYQGSRSVSIQHTAENDSRWIQTVTGLVPGQEYRLSGWIKGQDIVNVTGSIGASIGLFPSGSISTEMNGSFDWTEVSVDFTAPANGTVTVGCRLGHFGNTTTGKAWFDNISLDALLPVPNCGGHHPTIVGSEGDDVLEGTSGPDVIHGLDGNDTISGFGGDDILCGGAGNDLLRGSTGTDLIFGETGDDRLIGGRGTDTLVGGRGSDMLDGSGGDDSLHGNGGSDRLFGSSGNDVLKGGGNSDVLDGGDGTDECDGGNGQDSASRCETIKNVP